MSLLEWIILGIIIILCVAACIFVNHLKKQGHFVPGKSCAGCPIIPETKPKEKE